MLLEAINKDLKEAMKSQNKEKLETIRLIKAALTNELIKINTDKLTEEQEIAVISREVKQRKDAISEFEKAGRNDLVEKEQKQLAILQTYLPKPLTDEEISDLIGKTVSECNASGMKDMGKVMASLTPKVKGRADMAKVSQLVKNFLTN